MPDYHGLSVVRDEKGFVRLAPDEAGLLPTLYRGDTRRPEVIFSEGFQARNPNTPQTKEALLNHTEYGHNPNTPFVATSLDKAVAVGFGAGDGGVYVIHPVADDLGNLPIVVDRSVRAIFSEAEIVTPSIPTEQIVGAYPSMPDGTFGEFIPNPNYTGPTPDQPTRLFTPPP